MDTPDTTLLDSLQQLENKAAHSLAMHHPHAWHVLKHEERSLEHFVHESEQVVAATAVAGSLVMGGFTAEAAIDAEAKVIPEDRIEETIDIAKPIPPEEVALKRAVKSSIPSSPQKLNAETARVVSRKVQKITGIHAVSVLEGNELNTDYGYMGAEQHLPRYEGDTVVEHDAYHASGITAETGAFGYFASDKDSLSQEDVQREKYYVAVQSFLSPQWDNSSIYFKDWLKYRKVLIVNPSNGKAVVAVIADAGPAEWTGKQFGGSPEVVHALNYGKHSAKTPALVLFIDDQENTVPLGPVN